MTARQKTDLPTPQEEHVNPRQNSSTAHARDIPAGATAAARSATTRAVPERLVGVTALALAASMVIQNAVVVSAGAPGYADPVADVLAFHAEHRTAVSVAVALEALNVPLLLGVVVGILGIVRHRAGRAADWARLAVAAGSTTAALFAVYAVLWDGVVLSARGLTEATPELQLTWQMHAAAFAFALPALGATFVGVALATNAGGLTPRWQRLLGLAGGGLMLAAGTANLAIADGSSVLFVGVAGYFAWIIWVLVTGVRLVRTRSDGA